MVGGKKSTKPKRKINIFNVYKILYLHLYTHTQPFHLKSNPVHSSTAEAHFPNFKLFTFYDAWKQFFSFHFAAKSISNLSKGWTVKRSHAWKFVKKNQHRNWEEKSRKPKLKGEKKKLRAIKSSSKKPCIFS